MIEFDYEEDKLFKILENKDDFFETLDETNCGITSCELMKKGC